MRAGNAAAVVIGASMGGLLAARALSAHFAQVIIVERDALPTDDAMRAGVPQARHVHALLARGFQTLEAFFPGIGAALDARGAINFQWGRDMRYLSASGWVKVYDTGITSKLASRWLLEGEVRRRVLALPNVRVVERADVVDLAFSPDGGRVVGVIANERGTHEQSIISAELVVDASGRRSKLPEWLVQHGHAAPSEQAVLSYMGYATRLYKKPEGVQHPPLLFMVARPKEKLLRGAAIFEIEGGVWQASLGGMNGDYPPTDHEGFIEFSKGLATMDFYEWIKDAEPLGDIHGYRVDGSRWRRYDQLASFPAGVLPIADSVCGFNPLYGQGMTVAGLEAEALLALLGSMSPTDPAFTKAYFKRITQAVEPAWLLATGEDLRFEGTEGDKVDFATRLVQQYVDMLVSSSITHDETVINAFLKVANLTAPPTALMQPAVMARVLRNTFFKPAAV